MGTEKRERQKANRAQKLQQEQQARSRRTLFRKVAIGAAALLAVVVVVFVASRLTGSDDDPTSPDVTTPTAVSTSVPVVDNSVPASETTTP